MSQTEPTAPDDPDQDTGAGSGEGGSLGTPGDTPDQDDPSQSDQEPNKAVSGGGMVDDTTEEVDDTD
jgi:hypothetical protein